MRSVYNDKIPYIYIYIVVSRGAEHCIIAGLGNFERRIAR